MKSIYPNYNSVELDNIELDMREEDRKIIYDFLDSCRQTASEEKVKQMKLEILQVYNIIEKPISKWSLADIEQYLNLLNLANKQVWTKDCIVNTLIRFSRWAFSERSSGSEMMALLIRI